MTNCSEKYEKHIKYNMNIKLLQKVRKGDLLDYFWERMVSRGKLKIR